MNFIAENLSKINSNIREIEKKSNRNGNVKLLAVSKFHSTEQIIEAINAGQLYFGENRVQEAAKKFSQIIKDYPNIRLHIIGHLQSNKVKKAIEIASCIESVDRLDLIREIEKHAAKLNKTIEILLEMHTAEDSKTGFSSIEEMEKALEYIENNTSHIIPVGFMTMAPLTDNENLIRTSFRTLREVQDFLKGKFKNMNLDTLSMGMSGDYKIAIEEGSTQVRIGTAIFGEREYTK